MAYFNDPQDDENQLDPNQPAPIGPQGSGTIQGGGASGAPQAPAAPKAPDHASNFVGISQYLNANKPQAQKLGDQASGVITNSANDARSSVNDLNNTFNQKAGSATTIDPSILGKVNQAETLGEPEKQQIKTAYNAQYQGPNSLTDLGDQYNAAGKKVNTAKQNVESAGTEGGRQNLITQINEKPRTQGVTNFDSVLLQAGGGREKLNQAAAANKDVAGDVLGQNNLAAQQKAADIKSQTDATRAATQGAVGTATTDFNKQFDKNDPTSRLSQEIAKALGAEKLIGDLKDNSFGLDDSTLDALGLQAGQSTYGVDPGKFYKQGDPTTWNAENFATADDFARSQALAELAGGQGLLSANNASRAGTASLSSLDKEGLQKAIQDKGGKYDELQKPATIVTDSRFNSVPEQIIPSGGHPLLAAGGERMYREYVNGKTPAQLLALIPKLENSARTQYNDPNLTASAPAWVARQIKKYVDDLTKKISSKYTIKKNS